MSDDFLHPFVKSTDEYKNESDNVKKKTLKTSSFDRWSTYIFLNNSDDKKCDSIKKKILSKFSFGND